MGDIFTSFDRATHSDFLIHWTGKDIDGSHQRSWYEDDHRSKTNGVATQRYLQRLKDILTYGLWMTEEGERSFRVGTSEITIPATPQCCFTELKLSESRRHAARYGRLGIGVKRPFLFRRFGRPLAYFGFGEESHNDKFLEACLHDLQDKKLLNFFKPMNKSKQRLTYELYSESEWRLLFFDELIKKRYVIDPRDENNVKENEYYNKLNPKERRKLKYLIPLDGWFSMIIYPSVSVKNLAQWDKEREVINEIERIKRAPDRGNKVGGGNWPVELDLDACRHF